MESREPPGAPLDIYLDFVSPYAYLAWNRARTVLAGVPLRPRLVLLGPILEHHGQLGPAEIPPKRAFVIRDTLRRAAEAGMPLVWPERHPYRSAHAAKAVHALPEADRVRAVDALFAAGWGMGRDLEDKGVVRDALLSAGLDADATSGEAGPRLRAEVQAALARGVFGVPTIFDGDGELFFGDDQLERIARKRAGADPLGEAGRAEASRVTARPLAVDRRAT